MEEKEGNCEFKELQISDFDRFEQKEKCLTFTIVNVHFIILKYQTGY